MSISNQKTYERITYEELGEYIGNRAIVLVSKEWLDLIRGTIEGTKECSKCKEVLPLEDFNKDKRRQFGKRSQCKDCNKDQSSSTPSQQNPLKEAILPKIEYTLTNLNDE